jgi:hypothetical protein
VSSSVVKGFMSLAAMDRHVFEGPKRSGLKTSQELEAAASTHVGESRHYFMKVRSGLGQILAHSKCVDAKEFR